ncbi:MAG: hypothetical protein EZS28_027842 [Streblomastix strix]|uniref:Uncharacterized protein n=1 Tax=Streblomastix strix TaxID=222440 RepID=A0A5J4V3K7_9EUKA|nr:MAG: hypothetical protein EZS28_027842 [Streblomastix strix]
MYIISLPSLVLSVGSIPLPIGRITQNERARGQVVELRDNVPLPECYKQHSGKVHISLRSIAPPLYYEMVQVAQLWP